MVSYVYVFAISTWYPCLVTAGSAASADVKYMNYDVTINQSTSRGFVTLCDK